ncbi:MAG: hypothetical protein IID41_06590 [Planctomycetes bacterium]|nr:hypothetical protein [Planctomycetota bacterium]
MHSKFRTGVLLVTLLPLALAMIACDSPATSGNEVATVAQKKKDNKNAKTKNKKATNSETKKVAKRDSVTRKLNIARQKHAKSSLAAEYGKIGNQNKIAKAEQDLDIATTKLQHHEQYTAPNRLARGQLDLRNAEDRYKESQEEMTQLDLMYAEEDFADKTKEIVLQRGRRRLERSRTNLDIRSKTFLFLQNHSLPLEHKELQFKLEQASLLLAKTQRDAKAGELDKQIAILTAEAGVAKLEFELQVLDEEDDDEDDNEEDKE